MVVQITKDEITTLAHRLIGYVGQRLVLDKFNSLKRKGFSLLKLDNLNCSSVVSIVNSLDELNNSEINIQIPKLILGSYEHHNGCYYLDGNLQIKEEYVTSLNAAGIRNSISSNKPTLTATAEEELTDTMGNVASISSNDLLKTSKPYWVEGVKYLEQLDFNDDFANVFNSALKVVRGKFKDLNSQDFANFLACIALYLKQSSLNLHSALGYALPYLQLPRDENYFANVKINDKKSLSTAFSALIKNRAQIFNGLDNKNKPLDREEIEARFNENEEAYADNVKAVIRKYLEEPSKANNRALFEFDWQHDHIGELFTQKPAQTKKLSVRTREFFENNATGGSNFALTQEEDKVLNFVDSKSQITTHFDEIKDFFDKRIDDLKKDSKLFASWEKIIYSSHKEVNDFYEGLLSAFTDTVLECKLNDDDVVEINVPSNLEKFKNDLNDEVGSFFSLYRPIYKALEEAGVKWQINKASGNEFNPLFEFLKFKEQEQKNGKGSKTVDSKKKEALSLKFELSIKTAAEEEAYKANKKNKDGVDPYQLVWSFDPDNIGLNLAQDLRSLFEIHKLVYSKVHRNPISKKGVFQEISLENINSFTDVDGNQFGRLINSKTYEDLSDKLRELVNNNVAAEQKNALLNKISTFEEHYFEAIQDFLDGNLNLKSALQQAQDYALLIDSAYQSFNSISEQNEFILSLFKIGMVGFEDDPSVIVPPWQPERLKSLALMQERVINYCKNAINFKPEHQKLSARKLYEATLVDGIKNYVNPQILLRDNIDALADKNDSYLLLNAKSTVNGYSLFQEAANFSNNTLSEKNCVSAAQEIVNFIFDYLKLYPHLMGNLNVAFYHVKSALLPYHVIDILSKSDQINNIRLNLTLIGANFSQTDRVYRDLLSRLDDNKQNLISLYSSSSFISNLRVSVVVESELSFEDHNHLFDLCILYDVISNQAQIQWTKSPSGKLLSDDQLNLRSTLISYRNFDPNNDLQSSLFLVSPEQTESSIKTINAIERILLGANADAKKLPIKYISLRENNVRKIIENVHKISDWVVFYDDLLEKRQLEKSNIKVVRYKKDKFNGRNLVVSSNPDFYVMTKLVKEIFSNLGVNVDHDDLVMRKIEKDALELSGNVLFRAAKQKINCLEMLGLILSKRFIEESFADLKAKYQDNFLSAYFLLDDYASWFPTDQKDVADILAIGVCDDPISKTLKVFVKIIESKFVAGSIEIQACKKSKAQILSSLKTFYSEFICKDAPADRSQWILRFADLFVDAKRDIKNNHFLLVNAREKIKNNQFTMSLGGASLVYVYTSEDDLQKAYRQAQSKELNLEPSNTYYEDFSNKVHAHQVVFNKEAVKDLLKAYQDDLSFKELFKDGELDNVLELIENKDNINSVDLMNAIAPTDTQENEVIFDINGKYKTDFTKQEKPSNNEANIKPSFTAQNENVVKTESVTANKLKDDLKQVESSVNKEHQETSSNNTALHEVVEGVTVVAEDPIQSTKPETLSLDPNWKPHIRDLILTKLSQEEGDQKAQKDSAKLNEISQNLVKALRNKNMDAKVEKINETANGYSIILKGNDSVTEKSLNKVKSELYTSYSIKVKEIIPQSGQINCYIEKKYNERDVISLWQLWQQRKLNIKNGVNLSFLLGLKEFEGELMYLNYVSSFEQDSKCEPHSLIAGATGSGKSVLMKSLILDIAATNDPDKVKLVLLDPKTVEFPKFKDLPHLDGQVIIDYHKGIEKIKNLSDEMDRRYTLIREKQVNNLYDYNKVAKSAEQLPYIIVFHDEFADWMLIDEYKKEIGTLCSKLALKSRASGIYLFFAAQRPDKDVMPLQLRNNLSNKLIFQLTDRGTSRISMRDGSEKSAASLCGKGQMWAYVGSGDEILVQCPYVRDADIDLILEAIIKDN